jgi:hypothetical protein
VFNSMLVGWFTAYQCQQLMKAGGIGALWDL